MRRLGRRQWLFRGWLGRRQDRSGLHRRHPQSALGRVTDSRKRQGSFAIGIEFDTLREQERDILIGHALRKQAQMLKQERATPPRPR